MGEAKTLHFNDFGIFGRGQIPQDQLSFCLRPILVYRGKIQQTNSAFFCFLGSFHSEFIETIGLKAPGNYVASIRYNIFELLMGEPKTFHSDDFGILRRVQIPKINYYFFETNSGL